MKPFLAVVALGLVSFAQPKKRPADEVSTGAGVVKITPIRHASLLLEAADQAIYLDPAMGDYQGLPLANLILITDIHGDHMSPETITKIQTPKTVVFAPAAVAQTVTNAVVIGNGETKKFGNWSIEAVPMYNISRGPAPGKLWHDKGRGNGYVLGYGGKRFYFSGDTEAIPEMKALKNIDVSFVCMNLPYTMPPEEAAEAVRAFQPKSVYPYHYQGSNIEAFKKALEGTKIQVRLLDWYY